MIQYSIVHLRKCYWHKEFIYFSFYKTKLHIWFPINLLKHLILLFWEIEDLYSLVLIVRWRTLTCKYYLTKLLFSSLFYLFLRFVIFSCWMCVPRTLHCWNLNSLISAIVDSYFSQPLWNLNPFSPILMEPESLLPNPINPILKVTVISHSRDYHRPTSGTSQEQSLVPP